MLAASHADVGTGFVVATVVLTAFVLLVAALALRPQARAAPGAGSPRPRRAAGLLAVRPAQLAAAAARPHGVTLVAGAWCLVLSDAFESRALLLAGGLVFALLAAFLLLFCALALLGRPRVLVPRDLRSDS